MSYSLTAPVIPMRRRIMMMQEAMENVPDEQQLHIEPTHYFAHGLYAREVTLPQGSTAVGHTHAQEHICIISKGRVQVVSEDGVREIVAPATLIIPKGRKNCVHALEDTVWTTVHASDVKTPEEAEATLVLTGEAEKQYLTGGSKCLS